MSASRGQSDAGSSGQDKITGQCERKPNPVTRINESSSKRGTVQVIDYYYDQEKGDHADFEFKPASGGQGHIAVFKVTRSASSNSRDVLDTSLAIPNDIKDRFTVEKKKPKNGFYRLELKKKEGNKDLDLAKYFCLNAGQLSSSDEEQKSN